MASRKKQIVAPNTFISYSRKDSEFALKLAKGLTAKGVPVWLDQLNIIPGQLWDQAIEAAVKNCRCMLVVLSPASVVSESVQNEFNYALDERKTVIPVFHRDCEVPFRLRLRQSADFREKYERGFQELQKALVSVATLRDESESPLGSPGTARPVGRAQSKHYAGTPALFVTLHGGRPRKDPHRFNIHAYDEDGNLITPSILTESAGIILDVLRRVRLIGKYLYVVNANLVQNSVLCYEGTGTHYSFVGWLASRQTCNAILHPFDLEFDDLGYCYLSSQDTNVVTRFIISDVGRTARPAPVASALPKSGRFLPGTFVASSDGKLSYPPTTPVGAPVGLECSSFEDKRRSVRGIAWANGRLYVVDLPASTVKMYDVNGGYLGQSNEVELPTHIVAHGGSLYVASGDSVLTSKLPTSPDTSCLGLSPTCK